MRIRASRSAARPRRVLSAQTAAATRTGDRNLSADRRQRRLEPNFRRCTCQARRRAAGGRRLASAACRVRRSRPAAGGSPYSIPTSKPASGTSRPGTALRSTGVVSKETFAALNVPIDIRLHQLKINLVRLRSYSGNLGDRFVTANIPAMAVETVENGVVATRHEAGVGKIDRQSPVMMTKAIDINFNPLLDRAASLIHKDLIPRIRKDPNYLTEHKIRIFNKRQSGSRAELNRLEHQRRDQLPLSAGSGRRHQLAWRRPHQHQQSLWRLYA